MVLVGVFAVAGAVMIGLLYLCWLYFWLACRRGREIGKVLSGLQPSERLRPFYIRRDEWFEREEAWHKRYHWCLLLTSIFLGLAAFCAVLHWTEEWPFWGHIPLSALSGALVLLGVGWLMYGPVREYVLPLEDVVPQKR
mgnify:CR=1 FL=1